MKKSSLLKKMTGIPLPSLTTSIPVGTSTKWTYLLSLLFFSFLTTTSFAATFTVSNLNDSGAGSLRQAILDANSTSGADVIDFSVSGVISPLTALPDITDEVDIDGSGQTIQIDYASSYVLTLNSGSDGSVIQNLDLSHAGGSPSGFGIRMNSANDITIQNCVINNRTRGIYGSGGSDIQILNNDLTGSGIASGTPQYAIELSSVTSNTLPGGVSISGNTFGNANHGVRFSSMSNLIISDGSVSGTNVALSGLSTISTYVLSLNNVSNSSIDGLDASSATAGQGNAVWMDNSDNITVQNCVINDRVRGIRASGGSDIQILNNDLTGSGISPGTPRYAIELVSISPNTLPGGVSVSGNTLGNSDHGVSISGMSNLIISNDASPVSGTHIALSGLGSVSDYAFTLSNVTDSDIDGLDVSSSTVGVGTGMNIQSCDNITVQNCMIQDRRTGLDIDNGSDFTIQNNDFTGSGDAPTYALTMSSVTSNILPGGVSISGNTFENSQYAVNFGSMSDLIISDGTVANTNVQLPSMTKHFLPMALGNCTNVLIESLDFSAGNGPYVGLYTADDNGVHLNGCTNVTVKNCVIQNRETAIWSTSSTDYTIQNNDFTGSGTSSGDYVIELLGVSASSLTGGVLITGNTFGGAGSVSGIELHDASNLTISDGSVSGTNVELSGLAGMNDPIYLDNVSNSLVESLDLSTSSGSGEGLYLRNCDDVTVQNINASGHNYGIYAFGGSDIEALNNDVSNSSIGIYLRDLTANTLTGGVSVSGNTFTGSTTILYARDMSDLTISDGSVSGTNVTLPNYDGSNSTVVSLYSVSNSVMIVD